MKKIILITTFFISCKKEIQLKRNVPENIWRICDCRISGEDYFLLGGGGPYSSEILPIIPDSTIAKRIEKRKENDRKKVIN